MFRRFIKELIDIEIFLDRLVEASGRVVARLYKQVAKNLKKLNVAKTTAGVLAVLPLLIPLGASGVQTTVTPQVTSLPVETRLVSLTSDVVSASTPKPTIEVTESAYMAAQKAARQKAVTIAYASTPGTPDPGPEEKRVWVQRAAASQGIDWKLLEAVWQIETGKRWKSAIQNPSGASGPCQFMPGTWRGYASDGNGDGIKDITDARDCLFGAAKLLARNGANVGDHKRALFGYNHSMAYVNKVLGIAAGI